jgi:beta-mannosidase
MTTLLGRPRAQAVSTHRRVQLHSGWELCSTDAGAATNPAALEAIVPAWASAVVPGTVAEAMRRAGTFDLDYVPNFDERDWWFRCRFSAEPNETPGARILRFDGLATLAEVWLNNQLVLESDNMFIAHELDVSAVLRDSNTLLVRFRSLASALAAPRPRPRWRTKLVEHQQLRWVRTTLLGRMPGWSPPVRPVGPWRSVTLESRASIAIESGDVLSSVDSSGASVEAAIVIRTLGATTVRSASLAVGAEDCRLEVHREDDRVELHGTLRMRNAERWWPHTHGSQRMYDARLVVTTDNGDVTIELGRIAFRSIDVATADGQFTVSVNGTRIFCRGACWTTPDIVTLGADPRRYEALLLTARDAGMNMIRVGGTMTYEADAFYDCCDRLGILVWQDFMFANMDYPAADAGFANGVENEATSNIARLRRHPSLAVLCGNSEVEQQAAMVGIPRDQWGQGLFGDLLPRCCASTAPNVFYWASSPSGGPLPFHTDSGVCHYYGVGAYLRPLDDARRSNVRFAAECLGFANVPDQATIDALLPAGESPVHHPRWKARVPRDHGAGWDFEDVRDHYLESMFGVHAMRLRYADMERYLALSRVVTGEVMARTIGEWRRSGSSCNGALVWFFQDLWPGAGWGLLDSTGTPKAAFYAVKRAMQPVAVTITDEGANGLHVHVTNDGARDVDGKVRVALFRDGRTCVASGTASLTVPARAAAFVSADAVLGAFHDVGYAYRFGAAGHDLVVATFTDEHGTRIGDAFHFPVGPPSVKRDAIGVVVGAARRRDGAVLVTIRAEQFAQSVAIEAAHALPDDNYFHVAPGDEKVVVLLPRPSGSITEVFVQPLNTHSGARLPISAVTGMVA